MKIIKNDKLYHLKRKILYYDIFVNFISINVSNQWQNNESRIYSHCKYQKKNLKLNQLY